MIGDGEKNDHRHFAVEAARVEIGQKFETRAHETRPEAKRAAKVVGGQDTVIDARYRESRICFRHVSLPLRNFYLAITNRLRKSQSRGKFGNDSIRERSL